MVSWLTPRFPVKIPCPSLQVLRKSRFYSAKVSKPLRILFCGSDDFSSTSVRALVAERERNPQLIKSIDVLCRPGKRSGRSLKNIREVPIKAVAEELLLPIHERDTFTGWDLPKPQGEAINLIIAVSFGLFVPPRILRSAEYGGLNVHPSLLPVFRGPAPLQHTILSGAEKTGVTLQTLDDKSFDHGIILAQTRDPFLSVPNWEHCTYHELLDFISPKAAQMLVQGLRDRVFVPPLQAVGVATIEDDRINPPGYRLKHATKITPEDRKISLLDWEGDRIYRHYRALGRLWTDVWTTKKTARRLIFEDITLVDKPEAFWTYDSENIEKDAEETHPVVPRFIVASQRAGSWHPLLYIEDGDGVVFKTVKTVLRVGTITVEGQSKKAASKALRSLQPETAWRLADQQNKRHDGSIDYLLSQSRPDENWRLFEHRGG